MVLALLAVHATGLVVLALAGDFAQTMMWGLGVMPLAVGFLVVVPAAGAVRDRWVLRDRGVTVVAMWERSVGGKRYFRFIDQGGVFEYQPQCPWLIFLTLSVGRPEPALLAVEDLPVTA